MGLGVRHIGDAAINAVDAHRVHCVRSVRVRSMLLIVWHGNIVFLLDCTNHAQVDQTNAILTCEGFPQLRVRTWKEFFTPPSELMLGSIAVLSMFEVLERWSTEFDKEYLLHGVVYTTAQTPRVEPMTAGPQTIHKTVMSSNSCHMLQERLHSCPS